MSQLQTASPMTGGDGTYSYAKNSTLQRMGLIAASEAIKETLLQNFDVTKVLSGSTTLSIVDLGCSVGPNTFLAMETIIETIEHKYMSSRGKHDPKSLEYQVFFSDRTDNDFNTLFAKLPEQRKYYAAGVPGSFYIRLFPSSSVHLAYSAAALHWMTKVPDEVQTRNSPAWNKGRIHYTGASDAVVKAYMNQYEKDIEVFLSTRAREIVPGGMIVILMPGVPEGDRRHDLGVAFDFVGSILMDMVKEGLIEQDKVDSFNIPHVYPSVMEMTRMVEKNGSFSIVKMELRNAWPNKEAIGDIESGIMHLRALVEGTLANHFGSSEIVDEIFKRAIQQKNKFLHMLFSSGIEIGSQLFAVLKRK